METNIKNTPEHSVITVTCTFKELASMECDGWVIYATPIRDGGDGIAACYMARHAAGQDDFLLAVPEDFYVAQGWTSRDWEKMLTEAYEEPAHRTFSITRVERHARIEKEIATRALADLASPQEFRVWLESHDTQEIVGQSHCASDCPLARYLSRHGERILVYATPATANWGNLQEENERYVSLPQWASAFVKKIDQGFPNREVSLEEALQVLGQSSVIGLQSSADGQ